MRRTRRPALLATLGITTLLLAACGGGGGGSGGGGGTGGTDSTATPAAQLAKQCRLDALASAPKPVKITYWHAMTRANETTLQAITKAFNASQSDVSVSLVNQQGYDQNLTKFRAVAGTSDAPDMIQLAEYALQQMIDSQATVPAAACVAAADADLSDILPRVRNYFTVGGTLYPVPFNVSNPVFYYNKAAFTKAGLDPEQPPTSFAQIKAAAQALKASGFKYGFYYKRDAWVLEQFLALNGEPYVNNGNGRDRRATAVRFDTPRAQELLLALADLVRSGLAATNPASGPSAFDNLLAICNGQSAMTIDTSAALGTAYDVLGSGGCKVDVKIGVGRLPGGTPDGGALVGGGANYLVKGTNPAKVAAAWKFAQYLTTPAVQAQWSAGTGYVPISRQAVSSPEIRRLWAAKPGYKVAYDQIASGAENVATAGPVIGDYLGVRKAVQDMLEAILGSREPVDGALRKAVAAADRAIAAYNDRL